MSMQTISSPRWTRSGISRRPMKPVPPMIKTDMDVPPGERRSGRSLDPPRRRAQWQQTVVRAHLLHSRPAAEGGQPMSVVTVEERGPVTIVAINRPEKLNAINKAVAIELQEAFAAFDRSAQ